jgi:hypothetical protein
VGVHLNPSTCRQGPGPDYFANLSIPFVESILKVNLRLTQKYFSAVVSDVLPPDRWGKSGGCIA